MFQEKRANMIPLEDVLGYVNGKMDSQRDSQDRFTRAEVDAALDALSKENTVMVAGGAVFWI
jgi:hypothetical protein